MKPEIQRAAMRRVLTAYFRNLYPASVPQPHQLSESQRRRRMRIRSERKGMFALVVESRHE